MAVCGKWQQMTCLVRRPPWPILLVGVRLRWQDYSHGSRGGDGIYSGSVDRSMVMRTGVGCGKEDGTTLHGAGSPRRAEFEDRPIPACSLIWDRGGKRTAAVIVLAVVIKGRGCQRWSESGGRGRA
jgi:hypothetical protein